MGTLKDGQWIPAQESTRISKQGDFVRGRTKFRDWVRRDGTTPFSPEAGRYHLWVAYNCPWAQRTLITRNLKGLRSVIGVSVAHYRRDDSGWWFHQGLDDLEPIDGRLPLHHLYSMSSDSFTGSATVPVLWDRETRVIVSNESALILRMLNQEFDSLADSASDFGPAIDLYPQADRAEIDRVNEWVYRDINNGVYKCGFARTQAAYERAFVPLFEALDRAEVRLEQHRFLIGNQITEADVRLFPTLIRFDAVYYGHFKCNQRRIADYPNLSHYLRDLYQTAGFGETVRIDLYKKGYMGRSPGINPSGIVPLGPQLDFSRPHNRSQKAK